MYTPLITNCNFTQQRSVSPQLDKSRQAKEKSPGSKSPNRYSKNCGKSKLNNPGETRKQTNPSETESLRVYVRVRPVTSKELNTAEPGKRINIVKKEDNMIFVFSANKARELRPREERSYVFNDVFDETDTTVDIYSKALISSLENVISGYNSTLLAYGMTGAGKTHTMFGDIYNSGGGTNTHPGLVSLMVRDLFNSFETEQKDGFQFQMKFSYLEIYNEQIRDLLCQQQSNENLMIIEDPVKGIMIPNLSAHNIKEYKDIADLILLGNSKRVMASTNSNQFSSRSHAIIQIIVEKKRRARDIVETYTQSKLCLVDLAGSERAANSDNRGIRQVEGANINRSLLALGNCINVLSDNTKGAFVPYRDSKLTRLLKDSLGGNTKTMMIACISPFYLAYEETVNTLKYAANARNIKRKVVKNLKEVQVHVSQYKEIIDSLKGEIDILKKQLHEKTGPYQGLQKTIEISPEYTNQMESMLDSLGNKLLANLEENFELNQTLKELKDLKLQNGATLKLKIKELEGSYNNTTQFSKVSQEIIALKTIMESNEVIELDVEENLKKNIQEKKALQERILQVTHQNYQNMNEIPSQSKKYDKSSQIANIERGDLQKQSLEILKEEQGGGKKSFEKDNQILTLAKYIQDMEKKLEEKDKLLAHNQQLINMLSQKHENLEVDNKEVASLFQVTPLQSTKISDENLDIAEDLAYHNNPHQHRRSKSAFRGLCEASFQVQKTDSPKANYQEGVQASKESSHQQLNQATIATLRTEGSISDRSNKLIKSILDDRESRGPNPRYKRRKIPLIATIEELKKDAERLGQINFNNIKKKSSNDSFVNPRGFYFYHRHTASYGDIHSKRAVTQEAESKCESHRSASRLKTCQEKGTNNETENIPNKSTSSFRNKYQQDSKIMGFSNLSPVVDKNIFAELSYIAPQINEQSFELSAKDSLIDLYNVVKGSPEMPKNMENKASSTQTEAPISLYKNNIPDNVNYPISHFQYESGTFEEGNYNSFKNNIEPENASGQSYFNPNLLSKAPSTQTYTANFQFRDSREKISDPKIPPIPQEVNTNLSFHPYGSRHNFDAIKNQQQLNNYYTPYLGCTTEPDQQNLAIAQQTSSSQKGHVMQTPQSVNRYYEPSVYAKFSNTSQKKLEEPKRSTSTIRNLDSARDFIKNFRMRLNTLLYAVENNMLDQAALQEITQLVQEYHSNKSLLSANDYFLVKNLGVLALQKANQKPKPNTTRAIANQNLTRSVSPIPKSKNLMNASIDVTIQNQPKDSSPNHRKSPENQQKIVKKASIKTKSKTGILSNINSDYSKALSKFCKGQKVKAADNMKSSASKVVGISQNTSLAPTNKGSNENSEKGIEQTRINTEQTRQRSPNECFKEKDISARSNHMNITEVSHSEIESRQNIIDQNGAQIKLKMKNIRDKFEQIQKQNALKNIASPFKEVIEIVELQPETKLSQESAENLVANSEGC